jgi:chromosome segregation ATPase
MATIDELKKHIQVLIDQRDEARAMAERMVEYRQDVVAQMIATAKDAEALRARVAELDRALRLERDAIDAERIAAHLVESGYAAVHGDVAAEARRDELRAQAAEWRREARRIAPPPMSTEPRRAEEEKP